MKSAESVDVRRGRMKDWAGLVQFKPVQFKPVQFKPVQFKPVQFKPVQFKPA